MLYEISPSGAISGVGGVITPVMGKLIPIRSLAQSESKSFEKKYGGILGKKRRSEGTVPSLPGQ